MKVPRFYLSGMGAILTSIEQMRKWRHDEKGPIFYLSGRFGSSAAIEDDWIKRSGCRYRCFSYAYVCPDAFYYRPQFGEAYEVSVKHKQHIAMDSSAYSFHKFALTQTGSQVKSKNKVGNIEEFRQHTIDNYIAYCHANEKKWDFYFTFDYIKHSPTIYKITQMLKKEGLNPVPVFHGDEGLDWLRRYIDDGHKIIGIGTDISKRRNWRSLRFYYDQVFEITEKHKILCHGLAITNLSLGFAYPWFSLDSSTWARISGFGHIIVIDSHRRTLNQLHISTRESLNNLKSYNRMPKTIQKEIRAQIESHGFDFDLMRRSLVERAVYNGWVFSNLSKLDVKLTEDKIEWTKLF